MKMYFVAIVLPHDLNEKILVYKRMMAEKYGCKVGLKSPAHITIAPPFWMEEEKEPGLMNDTEIISSATLSFSIETNNFSSFSPRTLFVAAKENEHLTKLKVLADDFFRATAYKMKIENRPFHPHITIATRDLHKKSFWEAWEYFKEKEFKEEFEATGLSLLKHNGRNWDVVYEAKFVAA
jgi:2'-5' RNA ligase